MELTCTNCGKKFEWKRHRQTCSDKCAEARQRESVLQMKSGHGEIYDLWKKGIEVGIAQRKARNRLKKRG